MSVPHRWFQFGILDLMLLTTIAAVVMLVCTPVTVVQTKKEVPWPYGGWVGGDRVHGKSLLYLYPDGWYSHDGMYSQPDVSSLGQIQTRTVFLDTQVSGDGWTIAPSSTVKDAFLLRCGYLRLLVQIEVDSDTLSVLSADGVVRLQLQRVLHMEGSFRNGAPDGTWRFVREG